MTAAYDPGADRPTVRHASRARHAPRSRAAGGTLAGFLIGLLCGLTVAVVVAVFVTRSPVPFVNKAGRAPDRIVEPGPGVELPDPNKPLYSKGRPPVAGQPRAPVAAPQEEPDRRSILDRLFGRQAEPETPPPAASAPDAVKAPPKSADPSSAAGKAAGAQGGYLLQAGAFRSQSDADAMRGRLALIGVEGRVVSAEVNGQTMYRVRIGPYAQLDDVNKTRSRLAENGIEASVVRQR